MYTPIQVLFEKSKTLPSYLFTCVKYALCFSLAFNDNLVDPSPATQCILRSRLGVAYAYKQDSMES